MSKELIDKLIAQAFSSIYQSVRIDRHSALNLELAKQGFRLKKPTKYSLSMRGDSEFFSDFLKDAVTIINLASSTNDPEQIANLVSLLQKYHMVSHED